MSITEATPREITYRSRKEFANDLALFKHAKQTLTSTNPELGSGLGVQWNQHQTVFLKRQALSRLLYLDFIYQKIVKVPGVICEFGVMWGASMATLINLRGLYEPYNYSRMIYGFDTFSGFPAINSKDGHVANIGDYATSANYETQLEETLTLHESFSPLAHMKKFALVKGDVHSTLPQWLQDNPHAIISMAILDLDLYEPTKAVLELILPRLTRGSLLVFDELNCGHFPGETQAVMETLSLNKLKLERYPFQPFCSFAQFEG